MLSQTKPQTDNAQHANDNRKFPVILATEAMKWPPPVYWDADELFLHASGGSVSMIYAEFSNCKTTFAVCRALQIAKERDAKVLYVAAEGVGFIGPKVLLGAVVDWNNKHPEDQITDSWIDEHFRLIVVAPQIINSDLRTLKREEADWQPNIVFIDTLGASAAGENLAAMDIGTAIGLNLRRFCQEQKDAPYVSDVVVVHHLGKDKEKGATGSQYFMNDTDQALELTYLQDKELLQIKVTKARGGEKGRTVMFGVRKVKLPTKGGGVTVAVYPFGKDDPRRDPPKPESRRDQEAERVYQALKQWPPGTVVRQAELLDRIVVREPEEGEQQFKDRRDDWRKNKLRRLVWQDGNSKKGIPGRPGKIWGLVHGVAREQPEKPKQPYCFEVPKRGLGS